MHKPLPDRDRWLALGLLVLALALAYLVLIHPWWTRPVLELNARIDTLQQRDLRARMALSQQPEVIERLQILQAQSDREPGFMPETSPERATAALVQHLERAVAAASPDHRSCAIINRSPLSDTRPQRYPRAVVQVQMQCGIAELAAVLHDLESGSPRLLVDNLGISSMQRFGQPDADEHSGVGLNVSFDLFGHLRPLPGAADEN